MRLLDTTTLQLREFIHSNLPAYAILSHTWGDEEISYQEWCMFGDEWQDAAGIMHYSLTADFKQAARLRKEKAGYKKIEAFCNLSRQDGYKWAWVDTCCIDKSSSSELSEAINSMYLWYQKSSRCYVYMADVSKGNITLPVRIDDELTGGLPRLHSVVGQPSNANLLKQSEFSTSRWFKRGWTLQELIAPAHVHFYDREWLNFGSRKNMAGAISQITGIPIEVISHGLYWRDNYTVAERISWAADRITTREEDGSYCLLGLLDVHMPLLYGEGGTNAFKRLQEEIIKTTPDHSIFAWVLRGKRSLSHDLDGYFGPVLAASPQAFSVLPKFVLNPPKSNATSTIRSESSYAVTNRGLYIELPIIEHDSFAHQCCFDHECSIALLDCWTEREGIFKRIGIHLSQDNPDLKWFDRCHCHTLVEIADEVETEGTISLKQVYIRASGVWIEQVG